MGGRTSHLTIHAAKILKYIVICAFSACFLLISVLLQNKTAAYDKLDNLLSYGSTGKFIVVPSGLPRQKDNQIYINGILKGRVDSPGPRSKRGSPASTINPHSSPTHDDTANLNIRILLHIPHTTNIPKIGAQILTYGKLSKLQRGQRNAGILKN